MRKVLWISLFIPYDKVRHAGGQIHNYYLKALHKTGEFDIKLLTFAFKSDMELQDLDEYGIDNDIVVLDENKLRAAYRFITDATAIYNPWDKYGRSLDRYLGIQAKKHIRDYARSGYEPEVIIFQWTQMAYMMPYAKQFFPKAKMIAIEEDVTFLSYQRKMEYYDSKAMQWLSRLSRDKSKKYELEFINMADLTVFNNRKDMGLVLNEGVDAAKCFVWAPYFQNQLKLERRPSGNHDILFYGGMARQENFLSAIWFIENVMPLLANTDARFLIVGANPDQSLFKYESEKVKIVGFVEHVEEYLSTAMCLAAPLVLGAGVKIKIIEAMSAGIPVLTNDIGIEGIPAENGTEFFYCTKPEEYATVIKKMMDGQIDFDGMEKAEKEFIDNTFSYEKSAREITEIIKDI